MNATSHVEARRSLTTQSPLLKPLKLMRRLRQSGTWRRPYMLVKRWNDWHWLESHFRRDMPDGPFILFPMHRQPEASTTSSAPRWVDLESVVEQMAINAPQGMKIVVKENPQTYGQRGESYYGALARLENVHLSHPAVNTWELIRRADAVVTITGSTGYEAILLNTRIAVLGRPAYVEFPGVRRLDWPEQIFDELADPAWRAEAFEADRETFLAAYLQSVSDLGPVETGKVWPKPDVAGMNFGAAVRRALQFICEHDLTPQQFEPGWKLVGPKTETTMEPVA